MCSIYANLIFEIMTNYIKVTSFNNFFVNEEYNIKIKTLQNHCNEILLNFIIPPFFISNKQISFSQRHLLIENLILPKSNRITHHHKISCLRI